MESKPFRGKYYIKRVAYLLFHLCCDDFVIFLIHSSFSVTVSYEFIIHKRRRVNQVPDKIDCGFKKSRAAALFCYKIHSNKKYGFVYIKPQDWWCLNHFFEIKTRRTVNQRQSRIISPEKREEKKIVDQL